jgi:hypothetical protein
MNTANRDREISIVEIELTNEELSSRIPDSGTIEIALEALHRDG